jgi:hypothetical protein
MPPTGTAIQQVGDAQQKRDRDLEQRDHAESGRDSDREDRQDESRHRVLQQVAASAREMALTPSALERALP